MAGRTVILRNAVLSDAAATADVDRNSWPSQLAASQPQFEQRIAAFPAGQWVAEIDGRIVGVSTAQRITQSFLDHNKHDYAAITDGGNFTNSHDPNGDIYQLIGVGVVREFRGGQLGRMLIDRQIEYARSLADVERIIGFTRPMRYHRRSELTIDEYLSMRTAGGSPIDPVVAFHVDAGAAIVSIHADFRPEDTESNGYGVLIEYPRR